MVTDGREGYAGLATLQYKHQDKVIRGSKKTVPTLLPRMYRMLSLLISRMKVDFSITFYAQWSIPCLSRPSSILTDRLPLVMSRTLNQIITPAI